MILPGLALFYSGLVRSKNALGTMMHTFVIMCAVTLVWVLFGYTLVFGPDRGGVIGGLDWAGLSGVGAGPHAKYGPTVPHAAFVVFQLMFAVFTPAILVGAFAERIRFGGLVVFVVLWTIFVYCPLAHWVWGGGWLRRLGALDFAGGAVVHASAGAAGLACALVLGQRRGYGTDYLGPHSLPLTLLGTGLLWFGWFGFNGGNAMGANAIAATAIMATQVGAATAGLVWILAEWSHRGKPTALGAVTGAVAGMASVTPGAGYISPLAAIAFGAAAGLGSYAAIVWKGKIGYDDTLDVVGIHGVSGVIGLLATGCFASKAINPAGTDGLLFGNPGQLGVQAVTAVSAVLFSFIATYALLKLTDGMVGLRVSPEDEHVGLDLSQHNERAYS
jgi:Amt family ammonium transporter